jgi:uncharacterized phage-associated protein
LAAPYDALDIARYFLSKCDPEEGELISSLKLQKLLYYAQGFYLSLYNKRLFGDDIEAWMHGPVVPRVYHAYKNYGGQAIPPSEDFDPITLDSETRELLDEIYEAYGQFSAWKLRQMTRQEPPWVETPTGAVISPMALRAFSFLGTLIEA